MTEREMLDQIEYWKGRAEMWEAMYMGATGRQKEAMQGYQDDRDDAGDAA